MQDNRLQIPSTAKVPKERATSAFSHTSRGSKGTSAMIDPEILGGVVTNIEKLLTPRQKKKLRQTIRAR